MAGTFPQIPGLTSPSGISLGSPQPTAAQLFAAPGTSGTFTAGAGTDKPTTGINSTIPGPEPKAAFNNGFTYPLHTQGSKIIDATGKEVKLVSTALGGFDGGMPFGVWSKGHSIPAILDGIKNAGFNSIRLPISVSEFIDPGFKNNDGNLAVNHPELVGAKPINVLDYFLDQAAQRNLGVVLDMHGMRPGDYMPSQWYSTGKPTDQTGNVINGVSNDPTNKYNGQVNEADFIKTWTLLGQRYANHPAVIGFDLLNEPHGGRITWGTNDPNTDWRLAAERIGGALQQVAPNKLTIVEGMDAKQGIGDAWWGGNLSKVGDSPVRLNNVVYSPHDYGQSVYGQWWLNNPTATEALWDREWGYIAKDNIAPVWIGEFGARDFTPGTTDGNWIRHLLDYSNANGISWSYWIWHDRASGDTGGLTNDFDNQPEIPNPTKIQVLQQYMGSPQQDSAWRSGKQDGRSGFTPTYAPFDDTRPGFPATPGTTAFGGPAGGPPNGNAPGLPPGVQPTLTSPTGATPQGVPLPQSFGLPPPPVNAPSAMPGASSSQLQLPPGLSGLNPASFQSLLQLFSPLTQSAQSLPSMGLANPANPGPDALHPANFGMQLASGNFQSSSTSTDQSHPASPFFNNPAPISQATQPSMASLNPNVTTLPIQFSGLAPQPNGNPFQNTFGASLNNTITTAMGQPGG